MARATILHVDDEVDMRRLVARVLEGAGYHVVSAGGGLEALRLAHETRPDLVLLDVNMPELDGYDLTARLRGNPDLAHVPLVALSASSDRQGVLALGCDGYVAKPFVNEDLLRAIETYLSGRHDRSTGPVEPALRAYGARAAEKLERKIAELEAANAQLLANDRLRREFLQNVSHELATPLTPIVGHLKILRTSSGMLTDPQRRSIEAMEHAFARLRRQIENLLDLAHLDAGITPVRAPLLPSGWVRHAMDECGDAARERGVRIEAAIADDTPFSGDERLLVRALRHLIDNAIKFSEGRGATVLVECGRPAPEVVEAAVYDSGPGVPESLLDRVFDPFFQADGSATRTIGGSGLGLPIARGVARAHGGDVVLRGAREQPPASGADFRGTRAAIWLPAR